MSDRGKLVGSTATRRGAWPRLAGVLLAPARWLERSKGRARLALLAAYALILAALGAMAWREARLAEVPEVGDPFDTRSLLSVDVPDDRNAFVLYRRALGKLERRRDLELRLFNSPYSWPSGDAEALAFLAANDEAVALWRAGTEKPDALLLPLDAIRADSDCTELGKLRVLYWHAMVRASRCEDEGDLVGAWGWYRAVLRSSRHAGRHAPILGRLVGRTLYDATRPRIARWADDPRVDAALLRRALGDVIALNALTPPAVECIQVDYLGLMNTLSSSGAVRRLLDEDPWQAGEVDKTDWRNHLGVVRWGTWFLRHEPDRTRRVLQLTFANWLAHVPETPASRPPLIGTTAHPKLLFDAPLRQAPGVSPRTLAEWLDGSVMVRTMGLADFHHFLSNLDADLRARALLVVDLASQLHAREHGGSPPDSPADLVGHYLERLPEGYVAPNETPR